MYKLCYVKDNKAYFTNNWNEQWGDDWGDKPYEHNADEPYEHYWKDGKEYPILIKTCYFDLPEYFELPCGNYLNSPYSVEDINNMKVPWINMGGKKIWAGTEYPVFCQLIHQFGGEIYEKKKMRRNKNG